MSPAAIEKIYSPTKEGEVNENEISPTRSRSNRSISKTDPRFAILFTSDALTGRACRFKWPSSAIEWLIGLIVINDLAGRSRKLQNHVRAQSPPTVIVAKVITRNYPSSSSSPPPLQVVRLLITGATSWPRHRLNNDFLYHRFPPISYSP